MKLIAIREGVSVEVEVERTGEGYRVSIGDKVVEADLVSANRFLRSIRFSDGRQYTVVHHAEESLHEISLQDRTIHLELHDPLAMRRTRREDELAGSSSIKAIMPGRVIRILVKEGDEVMKGTGLLILEAMKMENEITSPKNGVVKSILVSDGQTVESGVEMITIE